MGFLGCRRVWAAAVLGISSLSCANAHGEVHGSGTTNPSKFFWQIMQDMQHSSKDPIRLTYRAVGSSTGQREFSQASDGDYTAGLNDFGSGDIPMSKERYDAMVAAGREMVHIPFSLGAIGVFHSIPAEQVGSDGLKLDACLLAKIFSGEITDWNNAEIAALNPNLVVPVGSTIRVGHRRLGSSSTGGFTGYLEQTCAATWTLGSGSTITWPAQANFYEVEGSPGMTEHIDGTPYSIGYLDAGHGHQRNMQEVSFINQAGTTLTSLEALNAVDANGLNGVAAAGKAAVDGGLIPASPTDDWSGVTLYNQAGDTTWPIVLVSYIYVAKDMSGMNNETVGLLKAFVDYVTSESRGQAMLADYSFNAIPPQMNHWSVTWNNIIIKPDPMPNYIFEDFTLAWTGQASDVISVKRDSFSEWKLGQLQLESDSLAGRLEAMETGLNDMGIVPLHGSGTTNPKNWFAKVLKLMEHRARTPMLLTYRAVGSSTGQKEFVGQESNGWMSYSHFGAGDIPMSSTNYQALSTAGHIMLHLPFALGALAIFHGVPQAEIGAQELKLSACLLAKIFGGEITTWDHQEIRDENPGINVPAGTVIRVGHRVLGSSSTGGLAGYLNAKCGGANGAWQLGTGSTLSWPTTEGFTPVQGSPGMQAHITDVPYSIGYLDAGHGHDFHLPEVALVNRDGQARTSLESMALGGVAAAGDAGVSEGRFPNDATADWSNVNLFDMPGTNTWPIVLVSYLYVKKDQRTVNPRTAAALQAFITTVLEDPDGIAAEFKFTSPSSQLRQLSLAAAGTIEYPANMESYTFERSTDVYNGMGDNVISIKRNPYDDYERGVLMQQVQDLRMRLDALHAATTPTPSGPQQGPGAMSTTLPMTPQQQTKIIQTTTKKEVSDDNAGIALALGVVAAILALLALVVHCLAMKRLGGVRGSA
mmetsp:Transcript_32133/g.75464  ORF Transcript_32133/g.75464 Transcript_32133/m.75464 type:complete len:927 (-) Transcript_32133:123-2903(-)